MKSSSKKSKIREQILKSLVASFKIEGIEIPLSVAELAYFLSNSHGFNSVHGA